MSPSAQPYRPDIDGLRAVAILLVTVFHFRLLPMGEAGFIGVDVFFVISGFLITGIIIRQLDAGHFSLKGFYLARLRRLMPALMATLVLYFPVAAFVFLPTSFAELAREALWSQLYLVNFYFWQNINYFGLAGDVAPLVHMWSLAIEEQFYLFFPLVLMLVFVLGRRWLVATIVLGLLASFALGLWITDIRPRAAFYLLPTRAWELLAGGLLALWLPGGVQNKTLAAGAGILGIALIALALIIHGPVTAFPGWFAALPVLGAMLLLTAGGATPTGRILSTAPMVWIGKISYPWYLVHWPVIIVWREITADPKSSPGWIGFIVSIALAWVIWRFVEQPIRGRRVLPSTKGFLGATAFATAAIIGFSGFGIVTKGWPSRFDAEVHRQLAYAKDASGYRPCEYTERVSAEWKPCPIGAGGLPPRVALIGDSHALALAPAVDLWLKNTGQGGLLYFRQACMPIMDAGRPACTAFRNVAYPDIEANDDIEVVLMMSSWGPDPGLYGRAQLDEDARAAAFRVGLAESLDRLARAGKEVILIDPLFRPMGDGPTRAARGLSADRDLADHQASFAVLFEQFSEVESRPGVTRISLIEALCETGICQAMRGGQPLFRDTNHLRAGAAPYFAAVLAEVLPRR